MAYNPPIPRVWSRVQHACTYVNENDNDNNNYKNVYIPITNQTVSLAEAIELNKMFYKGNILQYKGNSARFTKAQKYAQLAKGTGPSRTKSFATQTQTYSDPNNKFLLREDTTTYTYPNPLVGAPNNPAGPFANNIPNPHGCQTTSIQEGGILVCGTSANDCTGEIYKRPNIQPYVCISSSASSVPGDSFLCWNKKLSSYFPRQNLKNNNSSNKWPTNYKGFVSAINLANCNLT